MIIDEPGFAAETNELLAVMGTDSGPIDTYDALVAARAEAPDPALAGVRDPEIETADMYLPLRGGPTLVRIYQVPTPEPRPLVLWLHGGGFIGGTVADLDHPCSRLANLADVKVVSLEYRLAPEHPFPAALHDTYDAMRWLTENGRLIGGNGHVAAGGQSAGGALVAGACLMARDLGGPVVARQVLCYPSLDFDQDTESSREFDGVFLSVKPGRWSDSQYLAGQAIAPYAAPLRAESLAGLPPALVIGAGRDPLRDDARMYADRLSSDGVDVDHYEYADTMHAFLNFCGALSAGPHAVQLIASWLRDGPPGP